MAIKRGSAGSDLLTGTDSADDLYGLGGADTLKGLGGNDRLFGGTGIDAIFGGDGADQVYGEGSDDFLDAGAGNDFVHGGSGSDRLRGGDGDDRLVGGPGDDDVRGGNGNDTLVHSDRTGDPRSAGTSYYEGGAGRDVLLIDVQGNYPTDPEVPDNFLANSVRITVGAGGNGRIDYATGFVEPQEIQVGRLSGIEEFRLADDSNSLIFDATGSTTVFGGAGRDWFQSAEGNQVITGGGGADDYLFRWEPGMDGGRDTIHGFNKAEGDRIGFSLVEGDPLRTTAVEKAGHTIYTSTEIATGQVVHVLDVDAVGLPAPFQYDLV